ncbi:DNA polymerase III subunit delta' [Desulfovibrio sp. OttesenSCG-928-A18]|nr:DNA polymerase III subunit delta' [Desulfovibrio sp. OttesenSCG-928-A18]
MAAAKAPPAAKTADDDKLPGAAEIAAAFAPLRRFMDLESMSRMRGFLRRLRQEPPQVLILEGGGPEERLAAAHYWSLLLNCPNAEPPAPGSGGEPAASPCLDCPDCVRMVTHLHRDCFFMDGLAGSIKIDEVRAMRSVLGEPPREARYRVVIFREAQSLVEAAANALLKSFEEPRPRTSFVMLAPQRERLLPTLVSRAFVLTLPWPGPEAQTQTEAEPEGQPAGAADREPDLAPWEAALCTFLHSGQGFFERSGAKGSVDAALAQALCGLVRRALLRRILALRTGAAPAEGLEELLAHLPEARLRMVDEVLAECQDSLISMVSPALVLEWMATRLFLLIPRRRQPG